MATPIPCFVAGSKGYVWDANGAMRLRKKHSIMGCLVGSVAQFKNQNEVNYLPLELSADEVTLAVRQGWIELFAETAAPVRAASSLAASAAAAASTVARSAAVGTRVDADTDWEAAYHEYYSQFYPRVGFTGRFLPVVGAKRRLLAQRQRREQEEQASGPGGVGAGDEAGLKASAGQHDEHGEGRGGGGREAQADSTPAPPAAAAAAAAEVDCSEPGWRTAVTDGGAYTLPLTAELAAAARAGVQAPEAEQAPLAASTSGATGGEQVGTAAAAGAAAAAGEECGATDVGSLDGGVSRVGWSYPNTDEERLRFAVFCDLHRQGFMMTGGIKFGSDLLAYPGDPSLYHAQFTVRPVPAGAPLNPMVLKAVGRGSHAARKHLLLASYLEGAADGEEGQTRPRIRYLSFAPEAGFGSKA